MRQEHDVDVLAHDHTGGCLVGELRVKTEAEFCKKLDRPIEIFHRKIDEYFRGHVFSYRAPATRFRIFTRITWSMKTSDARVDEAFTCCASKEIRQGDGSAASSIMVVRLSTRVSRSAASKIDKLREHGARVRPFL
jgi:hypothetical protein